MQLFRQALRERTRTHVSPATSRRWLFVAYDQLSDQLGPLAHEAPSTLGVVLIECPEKARRRPYHKQKLAWVLTNMRHFALELAERGVLVRYVVSRSNYADVLATLVPELGSMRMMEAAEFELRDEVAPLVASGGLVVAPHEGWLTTGDDFRHASASGKPPWRMDHFYAHVRKRTGILMHDGKPVGGKLSVDADNRKPWRGDPPAPTPPQFSPDPVSLEVGELVRAQFADHPGQLDLAAIAGTAADAETWLAWAERECLANFGPYEDAMSTRSVGLFHTRLAPLLNLQRLPARHVLDRALALEIPLASREGFVRQILGWREFVHHVHHHTDGFRNLPPGFALREASDAIDLPAAYWGSASGLACLDHVVSEVWAEGYSHHITRLMILSNIAMLLEISPRALSNWFWASYIDAYDWVVEPNVLGMSTFALGELMTTKPYIAGAAYVNRMSDYCKGCAFDPKSTCPLTPLYWHYLAHNSEQLATNQRMLIPLAALKKRGAAQKQQDHETFEQVRTTLAAGKVLRP